MPVEDETMCNDSSDTLCLSSPLTKLDTDNATPRKLDRVKNLQRFARTVITTYEKDAVAMEAEILDLKQQLENERLRRKQLQVPLKLFQQKMTSLETEKKQLKLENDQLKQEQKLLVLKMESIQRNNSSTLTRHIESPVENTNERVEKTTRCAIEPHEVVQRLSDSFYKLENQHKSFKETCALLRKRLMQDKTSTQTRLQLIETKISKHAAGFSCNVAFHLPKEAHIC
ncbi:horsetail movement protein Hrs1/Mcp6 [Schizosaccharomyces japonicus yFS275]|uniref:Horsetail movement protein Hrs1/Mcp6 n=1 Tax=Schizosaccharomyces japonicus (strain yFS275 / FY16936) TaxID=402676 RepID=B6K614_SCHJY|nr:horsetail movement protein Hrs1/Mcp6 [Schizosaccharomyces japonicus yFS275]EEB08968.1 horsetail movement protein Hrs1/Mcp6 [Schizosaccharomyces japonicus yFS275]